MLIDTLKKGLGLTLVAAVMVGCGTSSEVAQPAVEEPEPEPAQVVEGGDNEPVEPVVDEAANLTKVFYFDFDQATLRSEARAALVAHAELLKSDPKSVRLEGHADERGTREYNMALGERRANAVRDFLVLQGVDSSILETVSYGEERPAVLGSNERGWAQNRRVELN